MLYSFIVLGYIPGTNIELSFPATLVLLAILAVVVAFGWAELHRRYLSGTSWTRQPLHASQLHLRGL